MTIMIVIILAIIRLIFVGVPYLGHSIHPTGIASGEYYEGYCNDDS